MKKAVNKLTLAKETLRTLDSLDLVRAVAGLKPETHECGQVTDSYTGCGC
jgi:hypothetical protein